MIPARILGRTLLPLLILLGAIPPLQGQAASPSDPRTVIQKFLKCWETGDASTFAGLLHDKVVFAYPGGRFDKAALLKTFADYKQKKKDIKIYFADYFISDGRKYVTAYQFAATDRETGLRFAVGTGVVCEIADGKIISFKEYWDTQLPEMQRQGELPLDEGQVTPWPASIWLRPETID